MVFTWIISFALMLHSLHLVLPAAIMHPTLKGVISNQTWFQSNLHSETPILYIELYFTIRFPVTECCHAKDLPERKRCCPLLVLSSYALGEKERCFSYRTLQHRNVFLRNGVFFLDPGSQENQDTVHCTGKSR